MAFNFSLDISEEALDWLQDNNIGIKDVFHAARNKEDLESMIEEAKTFPHIKKEFFKAFAGKNIHIEQRQLFLKQLKQLFEQLEKETPQELKKIYGSLPHRININKNIEQTQKDFLHVMTENLTKNKLKRINQELLPYKLHLNREEDKTIKEYFTTHLAHQRQQRLFETVLSLPSRKLNTHTLTELIAYSEAHGNTKGTIQTIKRLSGLKIEQIVNAIGIKRLDWQLPKGDLTSCLQTIKEHDLEKQGREFIESFATVSELELYGKKITTLLKKQPKLKDIYIKLSSTLPTNILFQTLNIIKQKKDVSIHTYLGETKTTKDYFKNFTYNELNLSHKHLDIDYSLKKIYPLLKESTPYFAKTYTLFGTEYIFDVEVVLRNLLKQNIRTTKEILKKFSRNKHNSLQLLITTLQQYNVENYNFFNGNKKYPLNPFVLGPKKTSLLLDVYHQLKHDYFEINIQQDLYQLSNQSLSFFNNIFLHDISLQNPKRDGLVKKIERIGDTYALNKQERENIFRIIENNITKKEIYLRAIRTIHSELELDETKHLRNSAIQHIDELLTHTSERLYIASELYEQQGIPYETFFKQNHIQKKNVLLLFDEYAYKGISKQSSLELYTFLGCIEDKYNQQEINELFSLTVTAYKESHSLGKFILENILTTTHSATQTKEILMIGTEMQKYSWRGAGAFYEVAFNQKEKQSAQLYELKTTFFIANRDDYFHITQQLGSTIDWQETARPRKE